MLARSCVLALLLLGACDSPRSEEDASRAERAPPPVAVQTAELTESSIARTVEGVAAIMNPDALLQLDADLRSSVIASEFSRSQLRRAETLMKTSVAVSQQTFENARRQADADETRQRLLEDRLRQTWGEEAPFLTAESRERVVAELSSGRQALVRMDFPASHGATPRNVRVVALSGGGEAEVLLSWVAPSGNQSMPGMSYFGLITAGPGLRAGDRARVVADAGSERAGLIIPNSAIVVFASEAWCYVEGGPQKFERRLVPLDYPVEAGYLVTAGFEAGTKVVVRGASTLLSREVAPDYEGEDDDDKGDKAKSGQPEASAGAPPMAAHASSTPGAEVE